MGYYSEAGNTLGRAISGVANTAGAYVIGKAALKDAQISATKQEVLKESEALRAKQLELNTESDSLTAKQDKQNAEIAAKQTERDDIWNKAPYYNDLLTGEKVPVLGPSEQGKITGINEQLEKMTAAFDATQQEIDRVNTQKELFNKQLEYFKSKAQSAFGSKWEKKVNKGDWMNGKK